MRATRAVQRPGSLPWDRRGWRERAAERGLRAAARVDGGFRETDDKGHGGSGRAVTAEVG